MRFHPDMFGAALALYGKQPDYPRTFALKTFLGREGKPITAPCRCHAPTASQAGFAVWTQANECAPDAPLKKLGDADITAVCNITTDFELPANPSRALALGRDFVAALVEAGLAEPGQPIEDSGAGPHVTIPISPIVPAEHGGGKLVSAAVARVVERHLLPLFTVLAERHGLAGLVELGAYDISRVISLPGTWRPGHSKPDEVVYLHGGYLRRWCPPYDAVPPVRRECARLAALIIDAAAELQVEQAMRTPYHLPVGLANGGRPGDAYNLATTAADVARLLNSHGWSIEDDRERDRIILSRPGKDGATSATIRDDQGVPIFYSFSTSCAPFEPKRGYAPFGVFLTLEHGGDSGAAARALRRQGYGSVGTVEVRQNGKPVRRVTTCGSRARGQAEVAR